MAKPKQRARIVSVGGGKGGVGKSVVAANLAIAVAEQGVEVALVDADLGAPNQHTMFGIKRPGKTMAALFSQEIEHLEEARIPTSVPHLTMVPGSGADVNAADLTLSQKQKLLRHLTALQADLTIIDVGAGTSYNAVDLFNLGDLRLVVTTPQLTSVQNAYVFLKASIYRSFRQLAQTTEQLALIEPDGTPRETSRVAELLELAVRRDARFAMAMEILLSQHGSFLVGNQMFTPRDLDALHAVSRMIRDFLGVSAPVLAHFRASRQIHDSVTKARPFLLGAGAEESARSFRELARELLEFDIVPVRAGRRDAFDLAARVEARPLETGPLPAELHRYTRKQERVAVDLAARLHLPGGATEEARVLDLSRGGARLRCTGAHEVGQAFQLHILELGAQPVGVVVRNTLHRDHQLGVEFADGADVPESVLKLIGEQPTRSLQ